MVCEVCDFKKVKPDVYQCTKCKYNHLCCANSCDSLFYNSNHTKVCSLTGACYGQRICEEYTSAQSASLTSNIDPEYKKKQKRKQQVKNSQLKLDYVVKMVDAIELEPKLTFNQKNNLIQQIVSLWGKYKSCAKEKQKEIQRMDQRCFIVAIMFSLNKGLCSYSSKSYIIVPHNSYKTKEINKKKTYKNFKVSDITEGTKRLKFVFEDQKIEKPICLKK